MIILLHTETIGAAAGLSARLEMRIKALLLAITVSNYLKSNTVGVQVQPGRRMKTVWLTDLLALTERSAGRMAGLPGAGLSDRHYSDSLRDMAGVQPVGAVMPPDLMLSFLCTGRGCGLNTEYATRDRRPVGEEAIHNANYTSTGDPPTGG